ncbi:DUF4383 domain-containing protein [filamentous cyanobacterium CCT1]|nr:DUF4383 domain-containing protein [filamentous cyanobacterium CCT1]PSN78854.1 DUF4383 domain-containing protein [filamentous cyanobacterium CCP4]
MKTTQKFALVIGIVYVAIGIMGFIPALISHPASFDAAASNLEVVSGYGALMGLFPVNTAHNIVHIVTGLLGIVAAISLDSSRLYAGQLGIYYTVLAIMGFVPVLNTFFGLFPIFGPDVFLHGLTGLLGIYFGFFVTPSLLTLFKREVKDGEGAGEVL